MKQQPSGAHGASHDGSPVLPFKLEKAAINKWIAELPGADPANASKLVQAALHRLNKSTIPPRLRLDLMESLRATVFTLSQNLEAKFIDAVFPLNEGSYRLAKCCIFLHIELAQGYALVTEDESFAHKLVFNRAHQALIIHRALQSFCIALARISQVYEAPSTRFWHEVYSLFDRAERLGLLDITIKDKVFTVAKEDCIDLVFKRLVLFALANPNNHRQREIGQICDLVARFAHLARFSNKPMLDDKLAMFYCNTSKNRGPRNVKRMEGMEDGNCYFIFTQHLTSEISANIAEIVSKGDEANRENVPSKALVEDLVKSLDCPESRKFPRFSARGSERALIFGFANIVRYISNTRSDDETKTIKASVSTIGGVNWINIPDYELLPIDDDSAFGDADYQSNDLKNRSEGAISESLVSGGKVPSGDIWGPDAKLFQAKNQRKAQNELAGSLANSSSSGYCFRWTHRNEPRIKVGELVGIIVNKKRLEVGVIRWISHSESRLTFGFELYSPDIKMTDVASPENQNRREPGLFLASDPLLRQPASLLMSPGRNRNGNWLFIGDAGEDRKYRVQKAQETTPAFVRYALFDLDQNKDDTSASFDLVMVED